MLVQHSFIYVSARLVSGVFAMLTTALLTRVLEPAEYGLYGLALIVMTFGYNVGFDWIANSFMRFGQNQTEGTGIAPTTVAIFVLAMIATATISLLAMAAGAWAPSERFAVLVGLVLAWSWAWFELWARFQVMTFKPQRYLVMNVVRGALTLLASVGIAWFTRNPLFAAIGVVLGNGVGSLAGRFPGKLFVWRDLDWSYARTTLAFGLPYAASMGMVALIDGGPRVVIQTVGSVAALGHYTVALLLVQNTLMVIGAAISSAGLALALKALNDGDASALRGQLASNATLLIAVLAPGALGIALTAHGLAAVLVAPKYAAELVRLAPWMAASAFISSVRGCYLEHAFQLSRKTYLQIAVTGLGAAVAIGLSVSLVPTMGALGAAIAVTVANGSAAICAYLLGRTVFPLPLPFYNTARILVSCAMMAVVVRMIDGDTLPGFAAQVAAGGCAYAASALALNILGMRDAGFAWLERLLRSWPDGKRGSP